MGQVPVGIIGSGRVATHFRHYFSLLGVSCVQWSRTGKLSLETLAHQCDRILVLITDDAIEPWIVESKGCFPVLSQKLLVHCSGSLTTPHARGAHPLMTFGPELYELGVYEKIPFLCERGMGFEGVFPELPNPSFEISSELKPLYHSLCVLSGNFTQILWKKTFADFESRLSLPKELLIPYLEQVVENLKSAPDSPATGPLIRKDRRTIESNLRALEGDPYQRVYQAFIEANQ